MVKLCLAAPRPPAGDGRGASRSSTCARCPRSTWTRSTSRCAGPGESWSRTRRTSTSAWGPRWRPGSPSSASTAWRRRCCGSAGSTRRTRRPGGGGVAARPRPGAGRRGPLAVLLRLLVGETRMTVREYKLPDPGEGLTEAEIVTWMVKVGDVVKVNDVVVEIETAKSLVELPSPYAGTVRGAARRGGPDGRGRHPDHHVGRRRSHGRRRHRHVQPGGDRRRRTRRSSATARARGRRGAVPAAARRPRRRSGGGGPDAGAGRVRRGRGRHVRGGRGQGGAGARPRGARARPREAQPTGAWRSARCWPSRRCASSPTTSASTCATLTPADPGGIVTATTCVRPPEGRRARDPPRP